MNKIEQLQNAVLVALYREENPPTLRNDIIAPLCCADLVVIVKRNVRGSIKEVRLTAADHRTDIMTSISKSA